MTTEQLIALVVSLIAGVLGMPLTQFLKSKLNLDGTSAFGISIAVSGVLAVLALVVGGQLGAADFTYEALPATLAIVWSTATLVYNAIRGNAKT